jgi:anti-sigma B factor antagonist
MKRETSAEDGAGTPASAFDRNSPHRAKKPILTLKLEHYGGALILHCEGRLESGGEFQTLPNVVAEILPAARRLIVDLAGVNSIDSGGLGELALTHMWAEAAGYELKFASPTEAVWKLFEITNLLSVFDVYGSVPEAMAALSLVAAQSA